jgi:hypothetical protein
MIGNLKVDVNLRDVSYTIAKLLNRTSQYLTLKRDNVVEGRSWEMAALLAQEGFNGVSTGELSSSVRIPSGVRLTFSPVLGISTKKKMYKNVITCENLKSIDSFL